ncbi:PhzF family phenazine biosynthesis protein [Microbacterium sp. SORGH_AS 505]|uniref:PhzF family phenazine biosynthesis protein n=1 Tax=Microbacterium sp. SORGH_AS_0505 TaxID=3041770 RepID=UPI00277DDE2B|nr:PhzF family phenazine biosynthesis protein [Microbacterium sp. SORGH_AS_0505]MDQ1126795.1 PhzF family phenazine biosynthesis protein [Microbacterium sp. SORGH_AS_0505]
MPDLEILRYAAFTTHSDGGNPAGVVLDASALDEASMQGIAADIDFSETAFVTGVGDDGAMTIRYFSPIAEVPFCGHATVATAVALADAGRVSAGAIRFATPVGVVEITVSMDAASTRASFTSIEPSVSPLTEDDLAAILDEIGLEPSALDTELPPRIAHAGNPHPVIVVADRAAFDGFSFGAERVRALMDHRGWPATITVAHRLGRDRFVARNLFPVGRITEDPATGSAAASFGAYLRSLGAVAPPAQIVIEQGAHVGRAGELTVDIPASGGIVVTGHAVRIDS